ncbi:MAG: hypothetical protein R3344_08220 [Acidobacteriota bacterium]|nr:hypothetical protein [Acidobacteriota bacterium]
MTRQTDKRRQKTRPGRLRRLLGAWTPSAPALGIEIDPAELDRYLLDREWRLESADEPSRTARAHR